jgi:hypothetical protein
MKKCPYFLKKYCNTTSVLLYLMLVNSTLMVLLYVTDRAVEATVQETPISTFKIRINPRNGRGRGALANGHHIYKPLPLPDHSIIRRRRRSIYAHPLSLHPTQPHLSPQRDRRSHDEGRRREVLLPAAKGARRRSHQAHGRRLQEGGAAPEGSAWRPCPFSPRYYSQSASPVPIPTSVVSLCICTDISIDLIRFSPT